MGFTSTESHERTIHDSACLLIGHVRSPQMHLYIGAVLGQTGCTYGKSKDKEIHFYLLELPMPLHPMYL
jgi:hypothetical protein